LLDQSGSPCEFFEHCLAEPVKSNRLFVGSAGDESIKYVDGCNNLNPVSKLTWTAPIGQDRANPLPPRCSLRARIRRTTFQFVVRDNDVPNSFVNSPGKGNVSRPSVLPELFGFMGFERPVFLEELTSHNGFSNVMQQCRGSNPFRVPH